jgi:hypothetical protein
MLDKTLPELQMIMAKSKLEMAERVMGAEDNLGAVVAELVSGIELPGGITLMFGVAWGYLWETINQLRVCLGRSINKYATFLGA